MLSSIGIQQMAATLILKNDFDSINFRDTTGIKLEDGTFEVSDPDIDDIRFTSQRNSRDLRYMIYKSRTIEFEFYVVGTTHADVTNIIQRISRMLNIAAQEQYINGGAYSHIGAYSQNVGTNDTGDTGLILQFDLDGTNEVITSEKTNLSTSAPLLYTARVISGYLNSMEEIYTSIQKFGTKIFRKCSIELEVEPFFTRQSRIVSTFTDLTSSPPSPYTVNETNRLFISGANIIGDAPALTRISTQITGGQGIIIARDAGISLLNSCTSPVYVPATGTHKNDMFCWGFRETQTGYSVEVNIVSGGSPNQYQYRTNDGSGWSSWSSSRTIVAKQPQELLDDVWIMFWTSTGHIATDIWTFQTHQTYTDISTTYNLFSNAAAMYTEDGFVTATKRFTIPPGCKSRYKVLLNFLNSDANLLEYSMNVSFLGYDGTAVRVTTGTQKFDWVRPPITSRYVDLGIIDLNPTSSPFLLHPNTVTEMDITIYLRTEETLISGDDIVLDSIYLVPVQDDTGYFHCVWKFDYEGREVFSNYDPSNPYICEISHNVLDGASPDTAFSVPLDATYAGNPITLIPGVTNTLLFLPIFSTNTSDWRIGSLEAGDTGGGYIAIRPRFLNI